MRTQMSMMTLAMNQNGLCPEIITHIQDFAYRKIRKISKEDPRYTLLDKVMKGRRPHGNEINIDIGWVQYRRDYLMKRMTFYFDESHSNSWIMQIALFDVEDETSHVCVRTLLHYPYEEHEYNPRYQVSEYSLECIVIPINGYDMYSDYEEDSEEDNEEDL